MRRPRLLLTALLLVAVAAPGVLGTTMCKVDADFDGAVNLGDLGLGSPGSTCSSTSTSWLGAEGLNQPSWNDVTCDALLSTTYPAGSGTRTVAGDLEEGGVGAACCGSLAKVRCFDGSNMVAAAAPPTTTTPAPSPPASTATAATDTKYFVTMTVAMPYSTAEFDQAKQDKYKVAVADAAGTAAANVDILSITEGRRRAGSVKVETKIRASDSASAEKLATTLGTGDTLTTKINTELKKQGLQEATGVSPPAVAVASFGGKPMALSTSWTLVLVVHVCATAMLF